MKRLLFITITSLLLVTAATPVHAEPTVEQLFSNQNTRNPNSTKFTATQAIDAAAAFAAVLGSGNGTTDPETGMYKPGNINGALPTAGQLMAHLMITPPVHTATYVADVLHNLRIPGVEPAYAQGVGFSSLTPVLTVWKAFRNMSYFLFIIVFVIIGFMIMFRKKIDAHTVASIQESLPKIIITLLVVTFSYAIAGFVIDLMYLSIFVVFQLFQSFEVIADANAARNAIFTNNIIGIATGFLMGPGQQVGEASQAISALVVGSLRLGGLQLIANIFIYLIIVVALLIAVFRTLFALVGAYIGIIISVIFAPIQLLPNAFPGNDSLPKWLQGLVANAAVFPAAAIMIILGAALIGPEGQADAERLGLNPDANSFGWISYGNTGFVPPLVGNGSTEAVRAIIGIGIIMLLPEVIKFTHELFQYKPPWYGEAARKNLTSGTDMPGKILSTAAMGLYVGQQLKGGGDAIWNWASTRRRGAQAEPTPPNAALRTDPQTGAETVVAAPHRGIHGEYSHRGTAEDLPDVNAPINDEPGE